MRVNEKIIFILSGLIEVNQVLAITSEAQCKTSHINQFHTEFVISTSINVTNFDFDFKVTKTHHYYKVRNTNCDSIRVLIRIVDPSEIHTIETC